AEDGIGDWAVTGVQTCALPIFFCGGYVVGAPGTLCHHVWLGLSARQCDRGHPLPLYPPPGDRFRRRQPYCAATSTSDSSYGHARSEGRRGGERGESSGRAWQEC